MSPQNAETVAAPTSPRFLMGQFAGKTLKAIAGAGFSLGLIYTRLYIKANRGELISAAVGIPARNREYRPIFVVSDTSPRLRHGLKAKAGALPNALPTSPRLPHTYSRLISVKKSRQFAWDAFSLETV